MQFTLILAFIVLLRVILLSCVGAIVDNLLISNNSQQWWYISNRIDGNCFGSPAKIVIYSKDWQNESKLLGTSVYSIPAYIFGKEATTALQKYQRFRNVYKLQPIHVSEKIHPASSVTIFLHNDVDFSRLLKSLQQSIWWNSNAKFLLIGFDDLACLLAHEFLTIIWSFNVLSVLYLCQAIENQWDLYTFNPYSSSAPSIWKPIESDIRTDERWTLFYHAIDQTYQSSLSDNIPICKNLYFDKLQNVHGYNLKLFFPKAFFGYNKNQMEYQRCSGIHLPIICQAFQAINAIFTVKFSHLKLLLNTDGQPFDNINEIITGKIDIGLFSMFSRDYWWLQTYPLINEKIRILTASQPDYSINFFMMFEISSWLVLSLLFILTVLSLKYIFRVSFVYSCLEFIRIFVNNATQRAPTANFGRTCFILIIYLWLVVNVNIQSHFSASKIAIDRNIAIDSFDDLLNSNFNVSGLPSYLDMIPNKNIWQRFIQLDTEEICIERLMKKGDIACIIADFRMKLLNISENAIHVSRESLTERGISWLFSEDSPLLSKVNSIMSRFNSAGIIDYDIKQNKFRYHNIERFGSSEFYIALRILIVGWALALGVAIIEIIVGVIMVYKLYTKFKFNLLTGL